MKEKILYGIWACLYILCVGLGTVDNARGLGKVLLILTALIFFIPGAWLLWLGQNGDRKMLLRLRCVAATSLCLTVVLLIANMFTVMVSEQMGKLLHELLALVSAPMLCGQYWSISLFAWACLLFGTFVKFPKNIKGGK